jgi:TolB protein
MKTTRSDRGVPLPTSRRLGVWLALVAGIWSSSGVAAPVRAQQDAVRRLTNTVNAYPFPSPDGKQVVFQSNGTGRYELMIVNGDGTGLRQLTDFAGDNVTPVWSPDGRWIAFASSPKGRSEIFLIGADGSGLRQLTDSPGDNSHPHWASDGARLFFNSGRDTPDPAAPWGRQWHNIYSVRPDGSDLRRHTNCQTVCTFPAPSPDGRRIAYRKVVDGPGLNWDLSSAPRNSEIVVADLDGSNERNLSMNAGYDGWPSWSPSGRYIAYASNRSGPANTGQIFIVTADGAVTRQVTAGRWSHAQPRWSADEQWLYVYQLEESSLGEFGNVAVIRMPGIK